MITLKVSNIGSRGNSRSAAHIFQIAVRTLRLFLHLDAREITYMKLSLSLSRSRASSFFSIIFYLDHRMYAQSTPRARYLDLACEMVI